MVMPHVVMPVVRVGGRGGGGGRDNPKGGQGKQDFLHDRFLVSSVPVGVRTPPLEHFGDESGMNEMRRGQVPNVVNLKGF